MTKQERIAILERETPENLMFYYDATYIAPGICRPEDREEIRNIIIKRMKGE